ncbi:endoribonuclease Dicer-like isoform X2 [Leptopilina heterotoma]|uniref:endoribonuclease Dicer-like isoform X2 n=1 Tax=Leptopilina heterotoma TaxID=63436 RepID=UPI001CAA0AA1|nr:endoribonuclease Dicer-like isoform X2 [Leptopilina heterotoma]
MGSISDEKEDLIPRPYQIDLFEKAIAENTIIYLPTGSGKTYIAVQVVKKLSAAIQGKYSSGAKRTIFIVNTVPLVTQQSTYLARHTGLNAKGFSGDTRVKHWDNRKWLSEIEDTPILVMIAQIFLDIVNCGALPLDRVNLIIFDECHRGVSDHPMRQIMQRFEKCPQNQRPRVLGLSATLLNSNVDLDKVPETIESLEVTYNSKIASTESLAIVAGFSTNPRENCIKYKEQKECAKEVEEIISEVTRMLKIILIPQPSDINLSTSVFKPKSRSEKLINILIDIKDNIFNTGSFGGSKAVLLHMIQIEGIKKVVSEPETIFVLDYIFTKLMTLRKFFDMEMNGFSLRDQIYQFSSDKVIKLIAVLKQFNTKKDPDQNFCCIIFVQRRFTAQVLYHILKSLQESDEEYKFLMPKYMVGDSSDSFKNTRENMCTARWNQDVLKSFREGETNCIVATDVVDEGVDIPECTLIVRFDLAMDFRSYIQSKGRARHSRSQYTMLVPYGDDTFEARYVQFQKTEKYLQQLLIGQTDYRSLPNVKDIEKELYVYKIEPFLHRNAEGKPCAITEQSAIALLNRYCANLYKSKFVSLTPIWTLEKQPNKISDTEHLFQVSLTLPIVSPLKETIVGDWMESIDDAKRSVAMKTCIKLKEIGELNDNLNPIGPDDIQENVNHLFPNWIEEEIVDNCVPGTYGKKRKHNLIHPRELYGAFPCINKPLFLHVLKMRPTFAETLDNPELGFYNVLKESAGYGILTTTELPEMPNFPIFIKNATVEVHVEVNFTRITLDSEQIEALKYFHGMLFQKILNLLHDFMIFDVNNLENSFAIVPVNENLEIDWKIIDYGVSLKNAKQQIFKVKSISTNISFNVPRESSKKSKDNIDDEDHYLLPELCNVTEFPALYWLKAIVLPSILYRIGQILIANDLKIEMEKEAKIAVPFLRKKPLTVTAMQVDKRRREIIETASDSPSKMEVSDLQEEIGFSKMNDIIRQADVVQMIRIETYYNFKPKEEKENMTKTVVKPKQNVNSTSRLNMTQPVIKLLTNSKFEGLNSVILMKALTNRTSNDIFDLERMETLGDSYLKFAVSLFLYETYKNFNEGKLTALKGKLIGNRNLYYCGLNRRIPGRINVEEFIPESKFVVPAFTVEREVQKVLINNEISSNVLQEVHIPDEEKISGYITESTLDEINERVLEFNDSSNNCPMEHFLGRQIVADKVVADSVESIIGASLCSLGVEGALNIIKWFQIIPMWSKIEMKSIPIASSSLSEIAAAKVNEHIPWASMLEKKINYTFNDRSLLLQAFSHPSYSPNVITPCYQRLEFLGDAVLDFLITLYIYESCEKLTPGDITDLRSALVNNITFACISVKYGLHTSLLAYVPSLHETINRFVNFQEEKNHAVDVELLWILMEENECNLAEHVDGPKVLGDIFESLIGAIYIDSGKDLKKVWQIVFKMMQQHFEVFCADVPKQPIRVIFEVGVKPKFLKSSVIESTGQIMVPLEIIVEGETKLFHGFGANKKQAKSAAAKQALKYCHSKKKAKESDSAFDQFC